MSITIEIYPQKKEKNIFSKVKQEINKNPNYGYCGNDLEFINNRERADDFIFNESDSVLSSLSSNQIISPYCKTLYINSHKIDDTFSASDIVENLMYINKEPINSNFIRNFENAGEYYSLVSKAGRSDDEIKLMIIIAFTLSCISDGLINFIEGGNYFGFEKNCVYNSHKLLSFDFQEKT